MTADALVLEGRRLWAGGASSLSAIATSTRGLLDWLRENAGVDGARVFARGRQVDGRRVQNLEDAFSQAPLVRRVAPSAHSNAAQASLADARQLHIPLTRTDRPVGALNLRVPLRIGAAEHARLRVILRAGAADRIAKALPLQRELVDLVVRAFSPTEISLGARAVGEGPGRVRALVWRAETLPAAPRPHAAEPLAEGMLIRAQDEMGDLRDVAQDVLEALARWLERPAASQAGVDASAPVAKASYMLRSMGAPPAPPPPKVDPPPRPTYAAPPVPAAEGPDQTADLPPPSELRRKLEAARVPFRAASKDAPSPAPHPPPPPPLAPPEAGGTEEMDMAEVRRRLRELGVMPFVKKAPAQSEVSSVLEAPPAPAAGAVSGAVLPAPPVPPVALDETVAVVALPTLARFAELQAAITVTNDLAGTLARFELTESTFREVSRTFAKLMRETPSMKAAYERLYFEQLGAAGRSGR